ncbi:MAG: hypothetical protein GY870_08005 [archaeon]|nr:hypothetical protein [archaeon]
MSDGENKKINEDFGKFSDYFQEVCMTLIAKMAEITDKLDRVTGAVEMVDKVRIQNSENKQIMKGINKGLEKLKDTISEMERLGFILPDTSGDKKGKDRQSTILDAKIDESASEIDDLSDLGEPPSMSDIQEQFGISDDNNKKDSIESKEKKESKEEKDTQIPIESKDETEITPGAKKPEFIEEKNKISEEKEKLKPISIPKTKPMSELKPELEPEPELKDEMKPTSDVKVKGEPISETLPKITIEEPELVEPKLVEPQFVKSASGIPKSTDIQRVENPGNPTEILNNLILDIEDANLESHVGKLVLQAKDKLTSMKPFHTIYFEMIMFGGKNQMSQTPNSPKFVEDSKNKVQEWKNTILL